MPSETVTDMQTKLINLNLSGVALCNAGANTRANILLTKRKETPMPMTFTELSASLEPAVLTMLEKHITDTVTAATKPLQEEVATLKSTKAADAATAPASKEEDVVKSLAPELQAIFKAQQEQISTLLEQEAVTKAATRYEAIKAIPCDEAVLKTICKSATPDVYAVLKAAADAISKSTVAEPIGSDAAGQMQVAVGKSAQSLAKLETLAKTNAAAKNITYEQAFLDACTDNPELYTAYSKGE